MLNAVIDLSHHNATVDFKRVAAAGVAGIIHKATQGSTYVDPTYAPRQPQALAAGLMWGAYHFGDATDPVAQASNLLRSVGSSRPALLALDVEENTGSGGTMSLAQAEAFVQYLYQKTGRWPGVYGGAYLKQLLSGVQASPLANCWLWHSQYGPKPQIATLWPKWTLWQYTDGKSGDQPYTVDGVGTCDRNLFDGTSDELMNFWNGPARA